MTTTNLGVIKAIFVGNTAPSNQDVIWKDTSLLVPLHKYYDSSSSSWQLFINAVQVDNVTIKIDIDGKIYVDPASLPGYTLANGSVTLLKMANVASGTVFYRKSAGTGTPEVQTLAVLKQDLGLTGTNSGDQDLSGLALKSYQINGYPLNGDINLDAGDIGAPEGYGTSTGINTGDETKSSILTKLEITVLEGENTGDQSASEVLIEDVEEIFIADNVEDALEEIKLLTDSHEEQLSVLKQNIYPINLVSGSSVAAKIVGATVPSGWTLTADGGNLLVTHNLNRECSDVIVWSAGRKARPFSDGYTGLVSTANTVLIEGLEPDSVAVRLNVILE